MWKQHFTVAGSLCEASFNTLDCIHSGSSLSNELLEKYIGVKSTTLTISVTVLKYRKLMSDYLFM